MANFYPVKIQENDDSINIEIGDEILFEFNRFSLSREAMQALDEIKRLLIDKVKFNYLFVYGFTDDIGSDAYNLKLSKNRANSVKNYLVNIGVDTKKLITKGYSESKPKYPNSNEENRKKNRRIEIIILKD